MFARAGLFLLVCVAGVAVALAQLGMGADFRPAIPTEESISFVELTGPLRNPAAEISGLAWHGDDLVLLPQYPERVGSQLFRVPRPVLLAARRSHAPLAPVGIPFRADGLREIDGYEGLEAIAFEGADVYVAVEVDTEVGGHGYLVRGRVLPDGGGVELNVAERRPLPTQTGIENLAYEALFVANDRVHVFYEANGVVNPGPYVAVFDRELNPLGNLPMAALEYRLTDVTRPTADGRFWALNYHYPESGWPTGPCPLEARFGVGESHQYNDAVERLVEMRLTTNGVQLTNRAPIQLALAGDGAGRNWEGIAGLDDGFVIVTDEHPRSLLGFVSR